jgi:hypothetical protein
LFASGDSRTRARLIEGWPTALRLAGSGDFVSPHVLLVEHVAQQADDFDIIHFHMSPCRLSLRVGASERRLSFTRAVLPETIRLTADRESVDCGAEIDVLLTRHAHDVGVTMLRRRGELQIICDY